MWTGGGLDSTPVRGAFYEPVAVGNKATIVIQRATLQRIRQLSDKGRVQK